MPEMVTQFLQNPQASEKTKNRVRESIEVITQIKSQFKFENLALSFNGGKDCLVMLHLILHVFKKTPRTVYIRPEHPFPELDTFVDMCIQKYNMSLEIRTQEMRTAFQQFLDENKNVEGIFVGIRRADPWAADLNFIDMTTNGWPKFYRLQPVLNWEYDDVWEFLRVQNINYCCLYDRGYTSLGSVETTVPNPALKQGDKYLPAYMLRDVTMERDSRVKKVG